MVGEEKRRLKRKEDCVWACMREKAYGYEPSCSIGATSETSRPPKYRSFEQG